MVGFEPVDAGPFGAARRAAAHVLVDSLDAPELSDEDEHHLAAVLRLRPGESVSVTDGKGGWRSCTWSGSGALEPAGSVVQVARPTPALCVAFAPVKGDRNEWAVQKLSELGVDRIVLLRTERSVVRWDERRATSHVSRLRRVARQALMQSRGMWLSSVDGIVDIGAVDGSGGPALADPSGVALPAQVTSILVGPEGGWSSSELEAFGAGAVSLGAGVLRTESAAVAAGVLLTAVRAGVVAPARG